MKIFSLLSRLFGVTAPSGAYRPDIDGLRAVAVVSVLIYHYFPGRLPGGFVGVDVFFVISGYLITGILARSFETHSFGFTIWDFYQRRIRRIFPAVSLVLLFLLVVGWLYLFPDEYAALGKHVAASAGFIENIVLWMEAGYFDADAIQKPLLHFWSLAVEEQFYLFWPLVLWFAIRRGWKLLDTISAIIVLSMMINVGAVWSGHETASFYLPINRTWELMIGAWLAVAHRDKVLPTLSPVAASQLSWFGLGLIGIAIIVIRPDDGFPGFWAMLPVLGSAMIVHAGLNAAPNRSLLSWTPAVWIGLISYPLYLWHWAIWSMVVKILGTDHSVWTLRAWKIEAALASVFLSWVLYRWIETPIRKSRHWIVSISLLLCIALVGSIGGIMWLAGGWGNRPFAIVPIHEVHNYLDSIKYASKKDDCYNAYIKEGWPKEWSCTLGDDSANQWIAVIGDSHVMALIPAFDKYGRDENIRIQLSTIGACSPFFDVYVNDQSSSKTTACRELPKLMFDSIKQHAPVAVVMGGRWITRLHNTARQDNLRDKDMSALEYGLRQTAKKINEQNVPVVLLKDIPFQYADFPVAKLRNLPTPILRDSAKVEEILNNTATTIKRNYKKQEKVNGIIDNISDGSKLVDVFDPTSSLCGERICAWAKDGSFLYADDSHLTVDGAMHVYEKLSLFMNSFIQSHQRGPSSAR